MFDNQFGFNFLGFALEIDGVKKVEIGSGSR